MESEKIKLVGETFAHTTKTYHLPLWVLLLPEGGEYVLKK